MGNLRVFHTLKGWSLDIDETPFLGAIDPEIHVDDSRENIDRSARTDPHLPNSVLCVNGLFEEVVLIDDGV